MSGEKRTELSLLMGQLEVFRTNYIPNIREAILPLGKVGKTALINLDVLADLIDDLSEEIKEQAQRRRRAHRCGSCRYWNGPRSDDWDQYGQCGMIEHQDSSCGLEDHVKAYTRDVECYNSSLNTREDFGCTLWETKRG